MISFLGDLRLALRSFLRAPGFAMVAVLTLALGIGVNTAIFSVVDGVMLRPLPYADADRLVLLQHMRSDGKSGSVSFPNFDDWRRQNPSFTQLAAFRRDSVALTGSDLPRSLTAEVVTANLFETLGVAPSLGRGFAAGEDTQGRNHVAVLSDRGWRRAFAGDPAILGRTISIDHTPFTVVGIMPASFRFVLDNADIDLFVPMPRAFDLALANERDGHYLTTVGRLAPGVSPEQVSAELQAMAVAHPESNADRAVRAWPLKDKLTATVRPALLVLVGAVAFILLIACANVANLLLARAGVRQHELAVRLALGATRGRLMRQLLTESVLLAVLGAGAGLLLALWSLDALKSFMPTEIARYRELGVDARVLGFTFLVALATGVVFGLVPALQLSGHAPWTVLKDSGGRTATAQPSRRRARNAFVVAEVAVATVLLVGAALMLRSFQRVVTVDPGFRPEELVTASIALPDARYDDEVTWARFYRELLPRLEALPGVEGVALGLPIPFTGTNLGVSYAIPGQPDENQGAPLHLVNPGWFSTLGIAVKAGRPFGAADDAPGAERVAMISENLARRHFGSAGAAIGKSIAIGWGDGAPLRIVGVAADVREKTLEKDPDTATYMPFTQSSFSTLNIAVRTRAPAGMSEAVRATVAAVDPALPVSNVSTMLDIMGDSLRARRMNTLLLATFGALALLLALVGAYGVMSYSVTQRVGEIAIRMALGARPGDVVRMVVGQGALLAVAGVALGVIAALALSRLLAGLLWGVSSTDPLTYVAMAVLFVTVVGLASWLPARRAARVEPMSALRAE